MDMHSTMIGAPVSQIQGPDKVAGRTPLHRRRGCARHAEGHDSAQSSSPRAHSSHGCLRGLACPRRQGRGDRTGRLWSFHGPCTCELRVMQMGLSGAGCVV